MKIFLIVLASILFIYLVIFTYNKDFFAGNMKPVESPLIIAHRGASGYAPENTLASVQKALDMGVDIIEVDIHLSKDKELIVIHDATLDRTTNGMDEVQDHTLAALKKLDAGGWFDKSFEGEPIPTLREVMKLINGQSVILIEIKKGKSGIYTGIEQKVVDIIRAFKAEKWSIVQSFEPEVIEKMHKIAPDITLHKLIVGTIPIFSVYHDGKFRARSVYSFDYVQAINPYHYLLTQRFINETHKRGMKVFTYTINDENEIENVLKMGVDGIVTNFPDRVKK